MTWRLRFKLWLSLLEYKLSMTTPVTEEYWEELMKEYCGDDK